MKKRFVTIVRIVGALLGVLFFYSFLKSVDIAEGLALVVAHLWIFIPILLLYGLACLTDTIGWALLMSPAQQGAGSFARILQIHVVGESIVRSIPLGAIFAEGVKPYLLKTMVNVEYTSSIPSLILRKIGVGISQGLYVLVSGIVGFSLLKSLSRGLIGTEGIEWITIGIGFVITAAFGISLAGVTSGRLMKVVHAVSTKVPLVVVQRWLEGKEKDFLVIDRYLGTFGTHGKRTLILAVLIFIPGWIFECLETVVILKALGAPISVFDAYAFEPSISFLRSLVFILPAGLGVMDLGYTSVFRGMQIPGALAVAGAFVMFKRIREAVWILAGYILLVIGGGSKDKRPLLKAMIDGKIQ